MNQSVSDSEIAEVWKDWHTVGDDFRRFENLPKDEQEAIMRGETVASEVVINDDLLWGSVFRYEPSMPPEELAAIFHNYNGQCRYVPGMPVTQVINQNRKASPGFSSDQSGDVLRGWRAESLGPAGSTTPCVTRISWMKRCSLHRQTMVLAMRFAGPSHSKHKLWEPEKTARLCSPKWVRVH